VKGLQTLVAVHVVKEKSLTGLFFVETVKGPQTLVAVLVIPHVVKEKSLTGLFYVEMA
jgi:hypothetical protein